MGYCELYQTARKLFRAAPKNRKLLAMAIHHHNYVSENPTLKQNERKTLWVVWISLIMMAVEITAGYLTGSMALLADGWHMASHVGALGIAYFAYRFAGSTEWKDHFSFGAGKFIPLGGYTSAVVLLGVAIIMAVESFFKLLEPQNIRFNEAIAVAVIGLIINLICAWILKEGTHPHHEEEEDEHEIEHSHTVVGHIDTNMRGAYFHVLADALTSILAIGALVFGKYLNFSSLDPLMGLISSVIILKWAVSLCKDTAWELLDGHPAHFKPGDIKAVLEKEGGSVMDLHVWTIAPRTYACELVIQSNPLKGAEFYRKKLEQAYRFDHIVIEERVIEERKK